MSCEPVWEIALFQVLLDNDGAGDVSNYAHQKYPPPFEHLPTHVRNFPDQVHSVVLAKTRHA